MIDIVEIDYSKYGLKNKKDFINKTFTVTPQTTDELNRYINSKKFILGNYHDYNKKYIQQIILPPANGVTSFNISRNYIQYIPFELLPDTIQRLDISHTYLIHNEIEKFPANCRFIKISEAAVVKIPKIPKFCKTFIARGCKIKDIPEVPVNIEELFIDGNQLKRLPLNIIECNNLQQLSYAGNVNIHVKPEELNFIEEIFERRRVRQEIREKENKIMREYKLQTTANFIETKGVLDTNIINIGEESNSSYMEDKISNIINDSQNVHDSMINKNMEEACRSLINFYKKNKPTILSLKKYIIYHCKDKIISAITKEGYKLLNSWIKNINLIFTRANITFGDIFYYVFFRITHLDKDVQNEIYDIFSFDFKEMNNICLTGKIGRIINLLNGKCEEVNLISETKSDRIQRIYTLCKTQAQINYRNKLTNNNFNEITKINIDENGFLFRKILYILFDDELKKMDDVDENEREIWLEPLILQDDEINKIKSRGKDNDENDIEKLIRENYIGIK